MIDQKELDWFKYCRLKAWIIWQDHLYYGLGCPQVSDREYDIKLKEFTELEEKHPYFQGDDSPTEMVGHDRFKVK